MINDWLAVADSRLAPYSSTRFRYLPFELEEVAHRPFLITLRPSGPNRVNIGIGREFIFSTFAQAIRN